MNRKCKSILAVLILSLCFSSIVFAEAPTIDDVSKDQWYYDYVVYAYQFGIITGTSDRSFVFEPMRDVTRAEFITMLGRMHEKLNGIIEWSSEDDTYLDPLPSFCHPSVLWATGKGVVQGDGNGYFRPNDPITREEMAVVINNYIDVYELRNCFERKNFISFTDLIDISSWSLNAVEILREYGIINGYPGHRFMPKNNSTRAESIKIIATVIPEISDVFIPIRDGIN